MPGSACMRLIYILFCQATTPIHLHVNEGSSAPWNPELRNRPPSKALCRQSMSKLHSRCSRPIRQLSDFRDPPQSRVSGMKKTRPTVQHVHDERVPMMRRLVRRIGGSEESSTTRCLHGHIMYLLKQIHDTEERYLTTNGADHQIIMRVRRRSRALLECDDDC